MGELTQGAVELPEFTREDFELTLGPYEWLYGHRGNRFALKQLSNRMASMASKVGVKNFIALYKDYVATLEEASLGRDGLGNQTDFQGQSKGLWCGAWTADDSGIHGTDRFGFDITACPHPILPVRRITNIDTGLEKVEIAFRRGGAWRSMIFDRSTLSDARSIVRLSDCGVGVNSDNAKHLVRYLADVESLNYDDIPHQNSVTRLGWIEGHGFSPFVEDLVFDGKEEFRSRFESIRERGDCEQWMKVVLSIRRVECVATRITLAASFASVLARPCSCLPFFLHLWGGSEAGKSVAFMLAASVWGDPEIGRFIQTFKSTGVGKELGAAFFNSLPLMLDELQLVEHDRGGKFQQMIYELAEGVGKARGRKEGGLQTTSTWRNCIMTNGEYPLIDADTSAGAVNRTVEIPCGELKLFTRNIIGEAKLVARFLQGNYGFVGRRFIEHLQEPGGIENATALQDRFASEISASGDVTDKQAASAALILAADALAEKWIFHDGITLKPRDIIPYLATKTRMDQNRRALDFLYDQLDMNIAHFMPERATERSTEIWGDSDGKYIYIIKSQFDRLLNNNNFNSTAFLGWARTNGKIRVGQDGKNTINHRILGRPTRCVWLHVREETCPEDNLAQTDIL